MPKCQFLALLLVLPPLFLMFHQNLTGSSSKHDIKTCICSCPQLPFFFSLFHLCTFFSPSNPPINFSFFVLGGCIRTWRPLGEFGGVASTVSRYFSNQQQPQQHGARSVGGPKPCEWRHTARSAARATHHSHSKERGWKDGGEDTITDRIDVWIYKVHVNT